ncbi:hypothetical protein Slin14017_G086240 [Septoria linicola]|nr:hypothetical protein Slin14017_G086240 [Septoria linicola]
MGRKKAQPRAAGARTRPPVDRESAKLHPACYPCAKRQELCSETDPKHKLWVVGESGATKKSRKRKAQEVEDDEDEAEDSPPNKVSRKRKNDSDDEDYAPKKPVRKPKMPKRVVKQDTSDEEPVPEPEPESSHKPASISIDPRRSGNTKTGSLKRKAEDEVEDEIQVAVPAAKYRRVQELTTASRKPVTDDTYPILSDDARKLSEEEDPYEEDYGVESYVAAATPSPTFFQGDIDESDSSELDSNVYFAHSSYDISAHDGALSTQDGNSGSSLGEFDSESPPSSWLAEEDAKDPVDDQQAADAHSLFGL